MRHFALSAAFALLAATAAGAPVSPAGTRSFAGWTGTCDNIGDCVAIATAPGDLFYVRIARAAGIAAPPVVKLVLAGAEPGEGAAAAVFRLGVDTDGHLVPLGSFPARPIDGDPRNVSATLAADASSLAFVDAIRNGTRLDYDALGAKGSLDLKGLAAVLRWIDARQGRVGTPTALVARGMTPSGQVPGPRDMPVIEPARPGTVTAVAQPVLSPALLDRVIAIDDCDQETVKAHVYAQAWSLGRDRVLVAVPCVTGAYNATDLLYFTDAKGGEPRPVPLPQVPGRDVDVADNAVTNMRFDPQTMILSEFGKGRGVGDCGETRTFVWTGEIFALLEATALDACPGALPADWPVAYRARRG